MQPTTQPPKLLDQVRAKLRLKNYAIRTEEAYTNWIRRFILFHNKRHPRDMGVTEVEAFLTHLAIDLNVAASTQNRALSALLFLYTHVLDQELPPTIHALQARKPQHLPTVLTRFELPFHFTTANAMCFELVKLGIKFFTTSLKTNPSLTLHFAPAASPIHAIEIMPSINASPTSDDLNTGNFTEYIETCASGISRGWRKKKVSIL